MDLTAQIIEAITAWLGTLAAQLLGPALESAGQLLFATASVGCGSRGCADVVDRTNRN